MLTRAQTAEFDRVGFVRLSGVFGDADAVRMRERVWAALAAHHGMRQATPETWTVQQPRHFQALTRAAVFDALGSPALTGAIDDLLGCETWEPPAHWGQPLITFPGSGAAWDVPRAQWHIDWPARGPGHPLMGLKMLAFLGPVLRRGGGTVILSGSHHLVARHAAQSDNRPSGHSSSVRSALMREHPWLRELWAGDTTADRIGLFMHRGTTIAGIDLQVVELTGAPGGVILLHPWLFHAPAPNRLATPRMMVGHNVNTAPGRAHHAPAAPP